jgi:hypothetical protein
VSTAAPVSPSTAHQGKRPAAGQAAYQLWAHLEAFACQVHASLNATEVAYFVANEGRRLIACDRLSVGLRHGRRPRVEAVSGVDVIDRHANLIRLMRTLFERVLAWGERLVYSGTRDESLPAHVLDALDAYLAESPSRLLVVLPLTDPRERSRQKPVRSALLMECFDAPAMPEPLIGRLAVVGRHSASALYNATEYHRIPLAWLWKPLGRLQDGIGGRRLTASLTITLVVAALVAALVRVPYPLKMDAKGQLLPEDRRWLYSPVEGQVVRFEEEVQPGGPVRTNQPLALLYDVQLEIKLDQLGNEIAAAQQAIETLARQENESTTETDRLRLSAEKKQKEFLRDRKILERNALRERTNADEAKPGYFWLKSPMNGTVLNTDFRESLTQRTVKPSEPLLRIGNKQNRWEIEVRIPQRAIGPIVHAFAADNPKAELNVDLMLLSCPTRTYKGKLSRARISTQAVPNRDNPVTMDPVVLASVRIDGPDIPQGASIPSDLLVTGTEVHAQIRCGDRPMGYSLFYGVWEFLREKVMFFF